MPSKALREHSKFDAQVVEPLKLEQESKIALGLAEAVLEEAEESRKNPALTKADRSKLRAKIFELEDERDGCRSAYEAAVRDRIQAEDEALAARRAEWEAPAALFMCRRYEAWPSLYQISYRDNGLLACAPSWLASTVFPAAALGTGPAVIAATELSARGRGARTMFGDRGSAGTAIGPLLPWLFGSSGGAPHFTTDDVHKALGVPAAEVKGSAELNVNVQVAPTEDFVSRIVSALRNGINVFSGSSTAGSTGLSMPEAVPGP